MWNGSNGEKNIYYNYFYIIIRHHLREHQKITLCTYEVSLNVSEKFRQNFNLNDFKNFQDLDENPKGGTQPQTEG